MGEDSNPPTRATQEARSLWGCPLSLWDSPLNTCAGSTGTCRAGDSQGSPSRAPAVPLGLSMTLVKQVGLSLTQTGRVF